MMTPEHKKWIARQIKEQEKWPWTHRIAAGLVDDGVVEKDFDRKLFPEREQFPAPALLAIQNALRDILRAPDQYRPPEHLIVRLGASKTAPERRSPGGVR